MKNRVSIYDELVAYANKTDKLDEFALRGELNIASMTNLISDIREEFGDAIADQLVRKLVASIKTDDPSKFITAVRKITHGRTRVQSKRKPQASPDKPSGSS